MPRASALRPLAWASFKHLLGSSSPYASLAVVCRCSFRSYRVTHRDRLAFIDTSTGEIQSESHLVKPPLHWDMQPVWDPDAEKLHGISLEQLHAQGRPPFEVALRMNEVLAGREKSRAIEIRALKRCAFEA